jgi:expansin (peptidoglycan-binding protein)
VVLVPVTYTRVVNPPLAGPVRVRIKEGSSRFWLSVPVAAGSIHLTSVRMY